MPDAPEHRSEAVFVMAFATRCCRSNVAFIFGCVTPVARAKLQLDACRRPVL
jgi:hypothetical protein